MSIAAHYLSKMMSLPGLNMVNRVGGAAVALLWGVFLVLVFVNIARVLPFPAGVQEALEDSEVADAIAGEDALPQNIFQAVIGDTAITALATIQDLFGSSRIVPGVGEIVEIPKASPGDLDLVLNDADTVLDEINKHRTGLGLGALQPSDVMIAVAQSRALDDYASGSLKHGGDCETALEEVGLFVASCDSVVALASTALGALDGLLQDEHGASVIENPGFDRVGIAVVDGPTGRLLLVLAAR